MKKSLLLLIAAFATLVASAHDFEVDGIYYNITSEEAKQAEVTFEGDDYWQYEEYFGSITIPATVSYEGVDYSVTSIGDEAFCSCESLTDIILPTSVTSIKYSAFLACENLNNITFPQGVKSIGDYAFSGCYRLTDITIPTSVTNIGASAFEECSSLTDITIPESVTSIGGEAFHETPWYNNLPDDVIYVGKVLYKYKSAMPNITALEVKEGTISIADRAFENCSSLTDITLPESVTSIGSDAFANTAWDDNLPDGMVYVGKILYKYKNTMPDNTAIAVKEGTISIANSAFEDCSGLTSITIPESVMSIGASAFAYCSNLTSITIPESVKSIGDYAFESCSSLTDITLSQGVASIGEGAFSDCSSLTDITLPETVTNIEGLAFYYCNSLTDVYCYAKVVPMVHSDTFFFGSNPEKATLHVPASALEAYQTTNPWNRFRVIVSFGDVGTSVDDPEFHTQSSTLIYDLHGNHIEKAEKGIYIVNGKKVVIK